MTLQDLYHFSNDDLNTNRSGELTPAQHEAILQNRHYRLRDYRIGIMIAIGIYIVALIWTAVRGDTNGSITATIFCGLICVTFAGSGFMTWYSVGDMKRGKISISEGHASKVTEYRSKGGKRSFAVKIGAVTFYRATREEAEVFQEGRGYRIYYVKAYPIHMILSAEAITH